VKIIIIGTAYPYRGGLAAFNERLAKEFIKEGNEVEIITFTLQYPKFLFPGKTQFSTEKAPTDLKINREINSINCPTKSFLVIGLLLWLRVLVPLHVLHVLLRQK